MLHDLSWHESMVMTIYRSPYLGLFHALYPISVVDAMQQMHTASQGKQYWAIPATSPAPASLSLWLFLFKLVWTRNQARLTQADRDKMQDRKMSIASVLVL